MEMREKRIIALGFVSTFILSISPYNISVSTAFNYAVWGILAIAIYFKYIKKIEVKHR